MKTKRPELPGGQIFSHPIRRLNADELKKVVGDLLSENEFISPDFHGKCNGGMDNQGRDFN
ncbi:MAG TPA: hypothetical protein VGG03_15940 [Thermoanaerobaculia bacterium]|jgi:hypothetical protein